MSSPPPTKRPRISSSALNAPFKSPVPRKDITQGQDKNSASSPESTLQSGRLGSTTARKPTAAPTSQPQYPALASRDSASSTTGAAPRIPAHANKGQRLLHSSPRATASSSSIDTELRSLQSRATLLTRQLSEVRNALDTAAQAERLERHGDRDAELTVLVAKWTTAARAAAEELLALAQDKVNATGGLAAFRARERERLVRRHEGFEADSRRDDGDGGVAERREEWGGVDYDERSECEKSQMDMAVPWFKENEEDTSFSMSMLLASLGIDVKAIGYDAKEQQWVG